MAKIMHLLDDVQIKHWVSRAQPVAKSDGDGLTFTLSKSGTATWVLRYRLGGGRRKEITLGNYPDLSLSEARRKAKRLRVAIDEGRDPALEKQKEKIRSMEAWLVSDLVANYRKNILKEPRFSASTIKYRNYDFDQVIIPKLGSRQVRDISPLDIVHILKNSGRSWNICKRILTGIAQIMDHAIGQSIIPSNPCAGIRLKSIKGDRPPVRRRVMLSTDEISTVLQHIQEIGTENALAFRILLATCVRTVELVKARWEHVDFERKTWFVPDESVKTRNGFLVPLTPTVIDWFTQLKALSGDSAYVLPARTDRRLRSGDNHVGRTTLWAAVTRAFERGQLDVTKFTPHDTRSTAKSHMRNLGISREISELALNHKLEGMEGIYDVREEIPERREALEIWAKFLSTLEHGGRQPSNVVPIRGAA